jgi:DNA processing protein
MDKEVDIDRVGIVAVLHAALHSKPEWLAAAIDALAALQAAGASGPTVLAATRASLSRHGLAADWGAGERALEWLAANPRRRLITLGDRAYPPLLAAIPAPPPVLYVDGKLGRLGAAQLAVVGSRKATASARDTAREFANRLVKAGLVITSGLAHGIDAAAHQGAVDGGGPTLAVFGCGVDHIYPAANRALAERIREEGALVSEFPLGTRPFPAFFPRRNRIISGLALGTLVVEAALTSGSLVTARHALDQGREVFAMPGSVRNPLSRGCHALLRDGAVLTETVDDILAELPGFTPLPSTRSAADQPERQGRVGLSPKQQSVYECCDFTPLGMDEIVDQCGLTASEVSSILTALEMKGVVRAVTGGAYVRTGKIPA